MAISWPLANYKDCLIFLMIVITIIKLNDPVSDHSIFGWSCFENEIPKDGTKPETPVRIFAMMMDMELV